MAIKVQAIKPVALNDRAMRKAINSQAVAASRAMAADMTSLTRHWSEGVKFIGYTVFGKDKIVLTAEPANPKSKRALIFRWVDKGTKKHPIPGVNNRNAKTLFFASQSTAGSKPNSTAVKAATSGPRDTFRKVVMHKGNKPRNWSILKSQEWRRKRKLEPFGLEAMKLAVNVSGHKYK